MSAPSPDQQELERDVQHLLGWLEGYDLHLASGKATCGSAAKRHQHLAAWFVKRCTHYWNRGLDAAMAEDLERFSLKEEQDG